MKTWKQFGVTHRVQEIIGNHAIVDMYFEGLDDLLYVGLFKISGSSKFSFICNLRISDGWNTFDEARYKLVSKAIKLNENKSARPI